MNKHPFPYYNGAYWVDNSALSKWLECPRSYQYECQEERVATFSRAALNYGKAIHLALAALSLSCGNEYTRADLAKIDALLDVHFERNPQPLDDHRTAGLAKETMRRYVKLYEVEPWTILLANGFPLIERLCHCQISSYEGIPVNFFGILDLGVTKSDGVWIVDRKTTFQIGKLFELTMRTIAQMKGYCWIYQKCFGSLPMGYIVDGIRSNAPSEKALADQKQLNKWWLEQFARPPSYVNQEQVDEWEKETCFHLHDIIKDNKRQHYPMNTQSCVGRYGACNYVNICTLPQAERLVALQSNNYMDNDWTTRTLQGKI